MMEKHYIPKLQMLRVLIERKDIKSFAQIFKGKHFSMNGLAKILRIGPVTAKQKINDPLQLTLLEIVQFAEAIKVDSELMLKIVWTDVKAKKKPR